MPPALAALALVAEVVVAPVLLAPVAELVPVPVVAVVAAVVATALALALSAPDPSPRSPEMNVAITTPIPSRVGVAPGWPLPTMAPLTVDRRAPWTTELGAGPSTAESPE